MDIQDTKNKVSERLKERGGNVNGFSYYRGISYSINNYFRIIK